jgi:hypothetical protein
MRVTGMGTSDSKLKPAFGFLTVVEDTAQGLCGGYLVLNHAGRPLEFHCTVPIKANRAQEILYGPTLAPFLYGEQIGQTLLAKAKRQPVLVCTDREPILAVQEFTDTPVALVLPRQDATAAPPDASGAARAAGAYRLDSSHPVAAPLCFQLGPNRVALAGRSREACAALARELGSLLETFDLAEPFERIREAIAEAQRAAR